jgi:hypothetical protein
MTYNHAPHRNKIPRDRQQETKTENKHTHTQSSIEPKIFPDIIIIIIIIPSTTFSCLPLFPFNIDSIGVL